MGEHPCKWFAGWIVIYLAVIIGGCSTRKGMGGSKPIFDETDMDLQWSVKGGNTEKNLKRMKMESDRNPDWDYWSKQTALTQFVAKDWEDGKDSNVLTKPALLEMMEVHKLFMQVNISVNGLHYTMFDLCDRGILPDTGKATNPIMPCLIVSPLACFSEMGVAPMAHPSYTAVDNVIKYVITSAAPYGERPSLADATTEDLQAILATKLNPEATGSHGTTRGCFWWTKGGALTADYWVGKPTWKTETSNASKLGNVTLAKAEGFRSLFYIDGAKRIQYRMSILGGEGGKNKTENIEAAQKKFSKLWKETCVQFNKRSKYIRVANLEDWKYSGEELEEEMQAMRGEYFLGGIALLLSFCALTLIKCRHPIASHGTIGFGGFAMIIVSVFFSFSWMFVVDVGLNGVIMICIPLLGLGLGLDDLFVFLRYFSGLGVEHISEDTTAEIIGEVMARAGPGAALTSACNCIAFFCGYFLPVQAMANFCLCAMFVALCNFITMINLIMPMLCLEVKRIRRRLPDPIAFPCHAIVLRRAALKMEEETVGDTGETDAGPPMKHTASGKVIKAFRGSVMAASTEEFSHSPERIAIAFIRNKYAPFLTKPIPALVVSILGLGLLAVSVVLISGAGVGYAPWDLYPEGNPNRDGMKFSFKTFSVFPGGLCFQDFDLATHQEDMLKAYKSFGSDAKFTSGGGGNALTMMYNILFAGAAGAAEKNGITDPAQIAGLVGLRVNGWRDPTYAPMGLLTNNSVEFWKTYNTYRKFPAQPIDAWKGENQAFMYADMAGSNTMTMSNGDNLDSKIVFGSMGLLHVELHSEDDFVDAIDEAKTLLKNAPASIKDNIFFYGPIFTFWEVFLELEGELYLIMGIDCAIIFCITLLFFGFDVVTAIITCLSCAMIVLEIFGLSMLFLNFNIFVAATVLMAMGMSVEFTAHLAAAFSLGQGDIEERLAESMAHTFPALVEGSISTFCAIFPLAFHPQMFVVKYLFAMMAMVVGLGVLNGVVIMPAMLSLLGPLLKYEQCCSGKTKEKEIGTTTVVPSG